MAEKNEKDIKALVQSWTEKVSAVADEVDQYERSYMDDNDIPEMTVDETLEIFENIKHDIGQVKFSLDVLKRLCQ